MQTRTASLGFALLALAGCATAAREPSPPLPEGFVRLSQIAPGIRLDIRYYGTNNFMGRRVVGYDGAECILTAPAAQALAQVQESVRKQGLTLVVFDCYRPARAVADFMAWTQTPGPSDPRWRPYVPKDRLVSDGYIAARSGHSRGSTIDLGLARLRPNSNDRAKRVSACAQSDRNTLDFGTPFDCFDPTSATASTAVSAHAQANRQLLLREMVAAGFRNYAAEWWHFTLVSETNKTEFFDFVVSGVVSRP